MTPCIECKARARCGTNNEYAVVYRDRVRYLAHRLAWMDAHGPIPDSHHVHHKCKNTLCVNPDHLDCVPAGDHVRQHKMRTHCKRGHSLANVKVYTKRSTGTIIRNCPVCARERRRLTTTRSAA